jgi:hypothetical protein
VVSDLASKVLGGKAGEGAELLSSFSKLGFKPEQIEAFLPRALDLIKSYLSPELVERILAALAALAKLTGSGATQEASWLASSVVRSNRYLGDSPTTDNGQRSHEIFVADRAAYAHLAGGHPSGQPRAFWRRDPPAGLVGAASQRRVIPARRKSSRKPIPDATFFMRSPFGLTDRRPTPMPIL